MRHTKAQKIGGQTVLALPPRNDVDIKVALSEEERQLYKRCEENALKFFTDIQRRGDRHVAKATFSLLSSLLPLRQEAQNRKPSQQPNPAVCNHH